MSICDQKYVDQHTTIMKRVVATPIDPSARLIEKYFPDLYFIEPKIPIYGSASAPIYFAISFKHDYEERKHISNVDQLVLGIRSWGGEYDNIVSDSLALGEIMQTYHDECGHKYCEQHGRYVLARKGPQYRRIIPTIDWKGSGAEVVKRFNEWFENNLSLPLTLNAPNTPGYATLVINRLYFMHGIKQQFIFPQGCMCYEDQQVSSHEKNKIIEGTYNNPLQEDGYAVYYNKGFAIVLPSSRLLNSELLWTRVWKEEQKERSKNINVTCGWNDIRYDTKMTEENIVRYQFLQVMATFSELSNKVPGVSTELSKSDLFTRFHRYNAVNNIDEMFPHAARRLRSTKYAWTIVGNVLKMKLSGKWEKKSLWLGSLPQDFNENTITKYVDSRIMKKLRNFQFLAESRTCFLNFNTSKDCNYAMDELKHRNQVRVEFAKKKQLGSKSSKKGKRQHEIGKCFQCQVKGHKEEECYYTRSILPIEIWFQILDYMNLSRLGKMSKICKYWNRVVFRYWKTIMPLAHIHRDYKITPLHAATWLENIKLIKFFINTGPSDWLNAQDQLGHTPLHYAYALQNNTIVKELKSRGAHEYIVDKEGNKPEALQHIQEKAWIRDRFTHYW